MSHETKRFRPGVRLRTLVGAAVLGPLGLVGIGVLWLGGKAVERAVQERLEEDVALVARAIQLPLSRALAAGEAEQLYEALESAFLIRRLYGASVYDVDGALVAEVGAGARGDEAPEVGAVAEAGPGGEYGRAGGRRVYSYFVPLTSPGGRIEGLLQVTRRRSDIEAAVRRVRVQAAGAFAVVWVLAAALVLVMYHRSIGRPLSGLSAAMAGVERGRRDAVVAEMGPRELAEMAGAFNRMVTGVEQAEAEVSSRRRREQELEAELRRSEKLAAIGRLAGGVAHELGTPLAVVDGTAQRMARGDESGESGVEAIRAEVRRMERIVRQLLEFGARESGERQQLRGGALLAAAAAAIRGEAATRGVVVEVAGSTDGVELTGDGRRLEGALVHMLRNAVQASPGGGRVRAWAEAEAEAVRFVVDDSGEGISEAARGRLFEPFFTTKAVGEGSGLGLAVVHAVAEEHGGRIELGRSELGGARFVLVVRRASGPVLSGGGDD